MKCLFYYINESETKLDKTKTWYQTSMQQLSRDHGYDYEEEIPNQK